MNGFSSEHQLKNTPKSIIKGPVDMKSFWRTLDEKYFSPITPQAVDSLTHEVFYNSLYGKKIFYPIQKSIEMHVSTRSDFLVTLIPSLPLTAIPLKVSQILYTIGKANPELISKCFGLNVYVDNYDFLLNSTQSFELSEEIDMLQEKLKSLNTQSLLENLTREAVLSMELDTEKRKNKEISIRNIMSTVLMLEMRQLAETISEVKYDIKNKLYVVIFDSTENMDPLALSESEYRHLMGYRDFKDFILSYDKTQQKHTIFK